MVQHAVNSLQCSSYVYDTNQSNFEKNQTKLWSLVLKFCDVSNPSRKQVVYLFIFFILTSLQPLYNEWTLLLREEMHREGDSMALLGLPVDGARDRNFPSTISKIQCWFIENRVQVIQHFPYKTVAGKAGTRHLCFSAI